VHERIYRANVAFGDARGVIVNDIVAQVERITGERVKSIAYITSRPGAVRANHWHPKDVQVMVLLTGSYRSLSRTHDTAEALVEQIVRAGDIVVCPAYVDHAYEFIEESVFLNLNTVTREPGGFGQHTIALASPLIPPSMGR